MTWLRLVARVHQTCLLHTPHLRLAHVIPVSGMPLFSESDSSIISRASYSNKGDAYAF